MSSANGLTVLFNWLAEVLVLIGQILPRASFSVKPVGHPGEDIDLRFSFAKTIPPMPTIAKRPAAWIAALVCLAVIGCGNRPSPKPVTAQNPVAQPPATTPAANPKAETASAALSAKPPVAPVAETVPTAVKKTFPAAASVRRSSQPFPYEVIRDSAGRIVGYEAFSDSAGVTAKGYGGPVPVQVLFDPQGRPKRIYILNNCETESYMDVVSGSDLLQRLLKFDPAQPESVDAVTLATESSGAIIKGVTQLSVRVANEIAEKPGSGSH